MPVSYCKFKVILLQCICSISVFVHCLGVILISGQVIGSLLFNTANLTLVELCFTQFHAKTQGLCMELTIFSSHVTHTHTHTHTHTLSKCCEHCHNFFLLSYQRNKWWSTNVNLISPLSPILQVPFDQPFCLWSAFVDALWCSILASILLLFFQTHIHTHLYLVQVIWLLSLHADYLIWYKSECCQHSLSKTPKSY